MVIEHIAVLLENRKGRLSECCRVLSEAGVNFLTTSIADTNDFGILRAVTDNNEAAAKALKAAGFNVTSTDLIAVEVEDKTGGMTNLLSVLDKTVDIDYMYSYRSKSNKGLIIMKVSDTDTALKNIKEAGLKAVGGEVL